MPRHIISFQSPWKQEDLETLNHPNLSLNSAREFPKLHSNHWKYNFVSKGCPYRCRGETNDHSETRSYQSNFCVRKCPIPDNTYFIIFSLQASSWRAQKNNNNNKNIKLRTILFYFTRHNCNKQNNI